MLISNVRPDLKSILHFFDRQHNFHTNVEVNFSQNKHKLRATLLFPYHKKDHFLLEKLEIFHHDQWSPKKGDPQLYGMALAEHHTIVLLGQMIEGIEGRTKQKLESRFRSIISKMVLRLKEELQSSYPIKFDISQDYLSVMTRFEVNGEVIAGRIEANHYFPDTVNDDEFLDELVKKNLAANLEIMEKYHFIQAEENEEQKIYITTIPIVNPVSEGTFIDLEWDVALLSEGFCQRCDSFIQSSTSSNIKLDLQNLNQHKDDLLIMIVGNNFECEICKNLVRKEKIVMLDKKTNQPLAEHYIKDLIFLGFMKDQDKLQRILNSAADHDVYFDELAEPFWHAYSYIALRNWDIFIAELTRKELEYALQDYVPRVPLDASIETLLQMVKKLDLTEIEKQIFWRKANTLAIKHYLLITIFGWDMNKEIAILGQNRAEFIFQNIPIPKELHSFYQIHQSYFLKNGSQEALKLHKTIERQQKHIRNLNQENGRLTQKLGEAYSRISELEQTSHPLVSDVRNKSDILKIQQLKGLIEDLKFELSQVAMLDEVELETSKAVLTEEPEVVEGDTESLSIDSLLQEKNILILGGFRGKQVNESQKYSVNTHDTRTLDPAFYDLLKKADIVIILTRHISHRAMWEAKEQAILEGKPIYYTSFINIPTIIAEVVKDMDKRNITLSK